MLGGTLSYHYVSCEPTIGNALSSFNQICIVISIKKSIKHKKQLLIFYHSIIYFPRTAAWKCEERSIPYSDSIGLRWQPRICYPGHANAAGPAATLRATALRQTETRSPSQPCTHCKGVTEVPVPRWTVLPKGHLTCAMEDKEKGDTLRDKNHLLSNILTKKLTSSQYREDSPFLDYERMTNMPSFPLSSF